jgi:type 1 glutamine amidotransferase
VILLLVCGGTVLAQTQQPNFRVVVLAEKSSIHKPFVDAAKVWLEKEGIVGKFSIDYIQNTKKIDDTFLSRCQLFIQLDYPPYTWTPTAASVFQKCIGQGKGGWIRFHHATLLGEFDGYPMWRSFSNFMRDIRYKNYIASFATAKVNAEDQKHPVMRGLGGSFEIEREEWYTYDKSPRPNVHVLASVDEETYTPDSSLKMGDRPVVWSNEHIKARNVSIFMGHRAEYFQNQAFTRPFRNSIFWAAHQ